MTFSSLDYFITVARERSFTRAAAQLHITQQTLSAHIAALEKEVGCQLLVRHIPLELTYAGEVFLRYGLEIQKKRSAMLQELGDIAHNEKGRLRIGIAHTRGHTIMPGIILAFHQRYPLVQVQLVEATNDELHTKLTGGEIDLAIANFHERLQGVELEDFYQEEVVLLVADSLLEQVWGEEKEQVLKNLADTGDLGLLRRCPFVLNHQNDIAGRFARELMERSDFFPEVRAESNNMQTLLELCVGGAGACFCPENLVSTSLSREEMEGLHLIRFGDSTRYMIRFGFLKQYRWSMIQNFIRIARETMER